MEANVNVQISGVNPVLAKYRATAQKYGRFFGQQIYTICSTNPDLKWREDVLADKNVLRKEVLTFLPKAIDIVDVKFLPKDLDNEPKIILNPESNDPNLVFPLVAPEFSKATRESVMDCIDRLSKKNSKPIFFSAEEFPMLNDLLKVHNQNVIRFYEDAARKYMKLAETVRGQMEQAERMQLDYMRECGVVDTTSTVEVNVNLEEA